MTDPVLAALEPLLAGSYAVERELGRGGMGVVYLARELRLDRYVAVKVLPPHLAGNAAIRERFLREARTAAQLSHPNVVPIYRAEEANATAYFVMAFIEGENLAERVRDRGPLPPVEVVRLLREAAWALAYAHARGVVHRDVKAANIMLERGSGRAVVTDFGIARDAKAAALTLDGEVIGTAHYMSPEQANGEALDGRSDLYSLGVAGFYALSGRLPFEGESPAAVMVAVATRPAPSLASVAPGVPAPLVQVIDRCLRHDPAERFATGEELADALADALERSEVTDPGGQSDRVIPTEQAQAIWLRAAQLQAEAATRLEQRSRQGAGLTGATPAAPTGGYRLRDVEAAASEVGISPEYLALALAEQPAGQPPAPAAPPGWRERVTTSLLGTRARSIGASRVIRASPRVVLETIGRVFPARPWLLTFVDNVGGHPLAGGVLVFSIPSIRESLPLGAQALTSFTYRMYQLELFQLNVTLRAVPAAGGGTHCEVSLHGDLRPGLRKNLIANQAIAATLSGLGAAGGTALGVAGLQLGALGALLGVGGAAVLGGAGLAWYRWLYRYVLRKSQGEFEGMLGAIEAHLRSQELFGGAPAFPGAPQGLAAPPPAGEPSGP